MSTGGEKEFDTIDGARAEIERLRRALRRQERDAKALNRINETNGKLRREHEREETLQLLFNRLLLINTPNMIFLFNKDLEYMLGSQVGYRLTRQEHRVLLHRPLPMIFAREIDGAWVEKITAMSAEAVRNHTVTRFNDTIRIDGESDIEAKISIAPIVDGDNACHGAILSINDVTELVAARRTAEDAARSKSAFLANMSHEIRTPMNAIKGLSELLALTPLTPTQKNYVNTVITSANSLIGVINDVLDFSKIEANRIEICPAEYSVHKLLSEICGVLGLRAEAKGLTLVLEIDPDIPSRLFGDDARLKQILLNLLSNAVKYTHTGRVVLRMSMAPEESAGADGRRELRCQIEDTGIGIREEDRDSLFNVFSRVDMHANKAIQGTGLGLAISKRLAEAMGGGITLASEYGKGSVFTLRLPQGVADAAPLASLDAGESGGRVLLLVNGERAGNIELMLRQLGVKFDYLDDSGTDVGLAARLAAPGFALPGGENGDAYTHCIYSDILPERDMAALRERLPHCRFAVLRSIINSMESGADQRRDRVLFNPLLVTEMAKFLNKSGAQTRRRRAAETSVTVRLVAHDVSALVVDDNRINLMVCEKMLELHGVEVTTAAGGKEAVALCGERKFDILFVDHMMPEMDGIEVTGEIRSKPGPNRKTPIIALTANVVNDMRNHYIKCGMDDFVGKPIDRKELARVLRQWLPAEKISSVREAQVESGA